MREKIIELLVKYAIAQKTIINKFSGDISGDIYKLHIELMDYVYSFDTENIDYFRDVFPLLPDDFNRMYQERYGN